ncbi:glycosyltransferase [Paracoccus sp. NGMCC 1.201697]|uniref:Glycosyltransferase n=1 Tax=Paracoccus broussonetiae subsp. drimophilus TaxID=3373869 RepID=A0ABW7LK02_9RHOB
MAVPDDSLLLGFSAPLFRDPGGRLLAERQTILGLKAWRDNFSHVTAFSICHDGPAPPGWQDVEAEGIGPEVETVPLPNTYRFKTLMRQRRELSESMRVLMGKARYRTFAYGGWIGDPGEIAASVARRNGLSHAIWFDRVESQVARTEAGASLAARTKGNLRAAVFTYHENRAARAADLTLLHGATVFDHFKGIARNPHQVEDIHYTESDHAPADFIERKAAEVADGVLNILYCGRAAAMKGPLDWIRTIAALKERGISFRARWLGDGEMLNEMRVAAARAGLTGTDLTFEGFVSDPDKVREAYRKADLLLFCHLTDESPRNLIESLLSATPIIGYRDPYSAGLVEEKGAGMLVRRGDVAGLVEAVAALATDRARLADLIRRAGASARHLTQANVFRRRSEIIRSQLNQPRR